MTSNASTRSPVHEAIMTSNATESSRNWRIEAQWALNTIDKLKETFHAKAAELHKKKKKKPKSKFIREKQALRKAGRDLRLARASFEQQLQSQAKALCRPVCEMAHERLPQELCDIIVSHFIDNSSVTFFSDKDDKITVANGASALQHVFETKYTGIGIHNDMIKMLMSMGARFDFRARHELLGKVFDHYAASGIDLPSKIRSLSLIIMESHLKDRELVLAQLERLTKLAKGVDVYFFVEAGHGTKAQVIHRVRRILRIIFPLLQRLDELDIHTHVVVNPAYTASSLKNGSDVTFSIAHDGPWRFELTPENATFTVEGFEHLLKERFEKYGELWNSRTPPLA